MTFAQHSAATPEHYTPPDIVNAARALMGGITLDPATTNSVNAAHVQATHIFTKADDGLTKTWHGNVFLNPPGGRIKNRSSAAVWWAKLQEQYRMARVEQAVFVGFSIEILQTTQGPYWIGHYPFCVPRRRIEFLKQAEGTFVPGESPTHANLIAYVPPRYGSWEQHCERFKEAFSQFGMVRT